MARAKVAAVTTAAIEANFMVSILPVDDGRAVDGRKMTATSNPAFSSQYQSVSNLTS
jgi:hypothetical protein